jgi:DNA replication and repair protein RecF
MLDRITLASFRNHAASRLDGSARFNLLVGDNGAGKTNVLEALSLLAPGRGLRRAPLAEMRTAGAETGFAVSAALDCGVTGRDPVQLGTGTAPSGRGGGSCRSTAPRRARSRSATGSRSAG